MNWLDYIDLHRYKYEYKIVKDLGDRYGYGDLMELVSAVWREKLTKDGVDTAIVDVPCPPSFIKEEYQDPKQHEIYDHILEEIKKEGQQ